MARRTAYVALGSNVGDRLGLVSRAWAALGGVGDVTATSALYDSTPALVLDQPRFLNAVVALETTLEPLQALKALKDIEQRLGRQDRGRWGPREIDLDLLFLDDVRFHDDVLTLPHERAAEREFVLRPLADVRRALALRAPEAPAARFALVDDALRGLRGVESSDLDRVWASLPLGKETHVMGVINVTPDSFSDGGRHGSVDRAVREAEAMARGGAVIVDVGGESTRPGAVPPTEDEELRRVVPAISAIRDKLGIAVSVDTRRAAVARAALEAGARIVNDVSGGAHDAAMLPMLADHGSASVVLMHSRGTPQTMQSKAHLDYGGDVVGGVERELQSRLDAATDARIAPWRVMGDPGIGFAKSQSDNLELLRNLGRFSGMAPLLVGPSRKGFIGALLDEPQADLRDWGTAGACCACVPFADVVRVHHVQGVKQALKVADAVLRRR
ncbi:Dihydropteroate synthase-like protein [Pelagophyceae sp. CCMP2097]|nr:Dihydropteroate synthase-like protein [Pelagophyceae sp. CCMP2097]